MVIRWHVIGLGVLQPGVTGIRVKLYNQQQGFINKRAAMSYYC